MARVVSSLKLQAEDRNIKLRLGSRSSRSEKVLVDASKLQQVTIKLLSFAISESLPDSSIKVRLAMMHFPKSSQLQTSITFFARGEVDKIPNSELLNEILDQQDGYLAHSFIKEELRNEIDFGFGVSKVRNTVDRDPGFHFPLEQEIVPEPQPPTEPKGSGSTNYEFDLSEHDLA
jgi:hypothetical protein